jgi:hypothetical protein
MAIAVLSTKTVRGHWRVVSRRAEIEAREAIDHSGEMAARLGVRKVVIRMPDAPRWMFMRLKSDHTYEYKVEVAGQSWRFKAWTAWETASGEPKIRVTGPIEWL